MDLLSKYSGRQGNIQETSGNPIKVMIAEHQWGAMEELIELKANEIDKEDGLVAARVIMTELGIDKKTLANYISSGKITPDMYVTAVNGVKKFWYKKIMGLEK